MNLPNIEGVWIILKPIQADMELVQSGDTVSGKYHNTEVKGTIKGTLTIEGEDKFLTGKWADQFGSGDFKVAIGIITCSEESAKAGRMSFCGNWRHSNSQGWDGLFEGEKRM